MDKKELTKYVSFFTMGDGGLYYMGRNKYPLYQMSQILPNKDYVLWKKEILENITTVSITETDYEDKTGFKHNYPRLNIRTLSHPFFEPIHARLYLDGRRVIDPHYLKLLDWEALSILYQDDGSASSSKTREGRTPGAYLNMNRYSYGDLELLRKALEEKLGLIWNIQSDGRNHYRLYLRTKFYFEFKEKIFPYMKESFYYKIPEIRMVSSSKEDDEIV